LTIRLAGCDVAFDGVSALEAGELLDELTWDSDQNHMIPQGSKWSTSAGQEAIRTFFWARWRLARARTNCIQVQLPYTGLDATIGVGSGNRYVGIPGLSNLSHFISTRIPHARFFSSIELDY
jgi:hypothetical protein